MSGAYLVSAEVGFRFAFAAEQISTVWPPTGIGIAALLLGGRALWPAIWLGAFVANAGSSAPLWTAVLVASGNTLEAVVAATLLTRGGWFDERLRRLRDVVPFIVVAAGLATMVSATVGVTTLCAAGVQSWARFTELWGNWWLGDAVGALIVAPGLLTSRERSPRSWSQWAEAAVFVGGTVLATQVVFGHAPGAGLGQHPLAYVIFPFVIAAAVRHRQPITSIVVAAASAVTIWDTVHGAGPFVRGDVYESLVLLQVFMGVLAGTGLLLAAAITERETGEHRRVAPYLLGEMLAHVTALEPVATDILKTICRNLEWRVAVLWLADPQTSRLACCAAWSERERDSAFVAMSKTMTFEREIGLPGRVWAAGRPAWIADIAIDGNFPRAAPALAAGLRSAFAVPVKLGDDVVGVIECFQPRALAPDHDLLQTMSTLGSQVGQFLGRSRDAAAVKQAEQDRERLLRREARARRDAEEANRAKDEFLATLSHELRTPLNAIVGWTRMLLDGTLDPNSRIKALEVIDRNAQLQAQLVADLLDVSRIITGGLRLDLRPIELATVIAAALDAVRPTADARKVTLEPRLERTGALVRCDPHRMQQVIWNLLANAVKFTGPGGTVRVSLDVRDATVLLTVDDDGAGIDPAFLPFVFDRFRQGDGSASRQHGGLGLGLAIVRHLVELHGGTVRADSAGLARGATFVVELPRADAVERTQRDA